MQKPEEKFLSLDVDGKQLAVMRESDAGRLVHLKKYKGIRLENIDQDAAEKSGKLFPPPYASKTQQSGR